jgi:hypothetical protein
MTKRSLSILFIFLVLFTKAQEMMAQVNEPQMADRFREDGKIYVVIAVLGIIFISIVLFLIYLERKLKKIEDKINK